jgi:type IV pilus assembly protein PilP
MPERARRISSFFLTAIFVLAPASTALAAQEAVVEDVKPPAEAVSQGPAQAGPSDTAEEAAEAGGYFYDPRGKIDPFKSFIAEQEEVAEKKRTKPRTYLETLDLSQLELIAIVVGPKGNYAMVRDSKGLGHVIRKGTAIGTKGGVVQEITDKEVVITEEFKDFRGEATHKKTSKKLPSLE